MDQIKVMTNNEAYQLHLLNIFKPFFQYGVALTFIAQIGITMFAFSPNRRLRIAAGWTHILHQGLDNMYTLQDLLFNYLTY